MLLLSRKMNFKNSNFDFKKIIRFKGGESYDYRRDETKNCHGPGLHGCR